jgi:putative phosphoribosyl transferase
LHDSRTHDDNPQPRLRGRRRRCLPVGDHIGQETVAAHTFFTQQRIAAVEAVVADRRRTDERARTIVGVRGRLRQATGRVDAAVADRRLVLVGEPSRDRRTRQVHNGVHPIQQILRRPVRIPLALKIIARLTADQTDHPMPAGTQERRQRGAGQTGRSGDRHDHLPRSGGARLTVCGQIVGPSEDSTSTNRCGGSNPDGSCCATHRSPPGRPSTARPSASNCVSATTSIGCQGGTSRIIAPGRVCHANTSASGWSTTLSYSMPMIVGTRPIPMSENTHRRTLKMSPISKKIAMSGWSGLARRNARRTFRDRREAGQVLADELASYRGKDNLLVLGLARGGVPVGWEVASFLQAPFDVFLVRKLGVPQWQELAMGALATGGGVVLNDSLVRNLGISDEQLQTVIDRETEELHRRESAYRGGRAPVDIAGNTVILVDDGIATGASMLAAVRAVRAANPAEVVVAVPVGPASACGQLAEEADDVVCATMPPGFEAVGQVFEDFHQVTDDEVRELLATPTV